MSKRGKQGLQDYLEHIQQSARRIQRYLLDIDHAGFLANEEKQDAVIRNLEIIGEAAENFAAISLTLPRNSPSSH